jgi:hypothetical protein
VQTTPEAALYVWGRRDDIPAEDGHSDTKH